MAYISLLSCVISRNSAFAIAIIATTYFHNDSCTFSGFYAHTKSYFPQATGAFEPANAMIMIMRYDYDQEMTIVLKNGWLDASLRFVSLTNVAISRLEITQ